MCETIEFELYDRPYHGGWNSAFWTVAYCPRCQKGHDVRADSAADASEGFGTRPFPSHTASECIVYLAEQLAGVRSDLSSVESTLNNVRNSF